MTEIQNNIVWHHATVTQARREILNNHKAMSLRLKGLSGSGESPIAHARKNGCIKWIAEPLSLTATMYAMASALSWASVRKSAARTSVESRDGRSVPSGGGYCPHRLYLPLEQDRQKIRAIVGTDRFMEIHCACSLEICEQREVKGFYKKARAGLIKNYTGISSPYEAPENPTLRLDSGFAPLEECVEKVISLLGEKGTISSLMHSNSQSSVK